MYITVILLWIVIPVVFKGSHELENLNSAFPRTLVWLE